MTTVTIELDVSTGFKSLDPLVYTVKESTFKAGQDAYGVLSDLADGAAYSTDITEEFKSGMYFASYQFNLYKSERKANRLFLLPPSVIDSGVVVARDLVNTPANHLTPTIYANRIQNMFTNTDVNVRVLNQHDLEHLGFDLLLSVGQGSAEDSQVVVMEYNGDKRSDKYTAFVGKGVTFDTGGISIKPSRGMHEMKTDMGGSAAVVGAMKAIADAGLESNIVGIVGLVENMPSSTAVKPGDVVTSLSGKTVENLNTDAEGRLVLADVLTYIQSQYELNSIVDLATLTGAIVVSLGDQAAGLFSNSTVLSENISNGPEEFWRMPMGENWNAMLESDVADIKNISQGAGGGSTTAAEFLYRFVDSDIAWAHLDIAGVAAKGAKATGFGVRTLFDLAERAQAAHLYDVDDNMKY